MNNATAMTPRLAVLKQSLQKKEAAFDQRICEHFDDVSSANGQPLNDKANGSATLGRWERQDNALRSIKLGIEKTKAAINREERKIANVVSIELPEFLRAMVEAGELSQWRRHPSIFFVAGAGRGRIVWDAEQQILSHRYASEIPKEQYPIFRDAFNKANAALRAQR